MKIVIETMKKHFILFVNKVVSLLGFPVGISLAIIITLGFISPSQAIDSFFSTLSALIRISPFVILSVVVAAYLKASGADQIVASTFQGKPIKAIAVASIFGAL